jgi:N-methylhydantoinase B
MTIVKIAETPRITIDPVTLDIVENALGNIRHEMDAMLNRTAMSPVIREQHDHFPMITDQYGRMLAGHFGSYIAGMVRRWSQTIEPGDVFVLSDPYLCGGAISHVNDLLVLLPIFDDAAQPELIGWASMFGHAQDVGGPLPGSLPTGATTIFGEGLRLPPVKLYERGRLNQAVLDIMLNNVRQPEMNRADLFGIVAACRTAEKRVLELCERFGKDTYLAACQALLDRTYRAMQQLIVQNLPEEPQSFEDYIDDDGLGNGPFKMKLTLWREGDQAYFDWTGTAPQALGPINFYLNESLFKMFIGVYLIMVFDPQILFNDGFYDLLHVTVPPASILRPEFPAALGCRTHTLTRLFDVLGGALSKRTPELSTAAGYGTAPYLLYSGYDSDGNFFYLMEINHGGIPGRPIGDGMDGHSWWPLFMNIPTEYMESYYPIRIERYTSIEDSGGAGFHRGGNGIEKVYTFLEPGEISIHDDRWLTQPWGIMGGTPGMRSMKLLKRADGSEQILPSKCDQIRVQPGDTLIYRTAGGGGWKDPLTRPPELVQRDVRYGLVSVEKAARDYGVILTTNLELDGTATEARRAEIARTRGPIEDFTFGRALDVLLAHAEQETGLPAPRAPQPVQWAIMRTARRGAAEGDNSSTPPEQTLRSVSAVDAAPTATVG